MIFDQLYRRFRVYPIEGGGGCSKTNEVTVTSEHQVLSCRKIPRVGRLGEAAAGFYRTWPRYEAREAKNSTGWTFGRGRSRVLSYVAEV